MTPRSWRSSGGEEDAATDAKEKCNESPRWSAAPRPCLGKHRLSTGYRRRGRQPEAEKYRAASASHTGCELCPCGTRRQPALPFWLRSGSVHSQGKEIGRASCRERV